MPNILILFKRFAYLLRKDRLDKVLLALLLISVAGTAGISFFEPALSPLDAAWWTIVTITTVGYGDIYPFSLGGRIVGVFLMLFGIGFLGMLTATLASTFIEQRRQEGKGMNPVTVKHHFVICGWNYKAKEILEEIRADAKARDCPVVLIADLPEKPLEEDNVYFVSGVVSRETLEMANTQEAQVAIVLADEHVEVHTRDAKTILDTLTVKTTYPHLYTCVELVDRKNIDHCKMAKADEIIVTGALSTNLLVQAALDHGVTEIISELVSNRYGHVLYKIAVPQACAGRPFLDVFTQLKTDQNLIVVAVGSHNEGKFLANPPNSYIIDTQDQLVVIGLQRPD